MVPIRSHSSEHTPGVVGLGVVVVVVVVVVVTVVDVEELVVDEEDVAVLAASSSFSIEMGVVEGVGHPVNSVVALKIRKEACLFEYT